MKNYAFYVFDAFLVIFNPIQLRSQFRVMQILPKLEWLSTSKLGLGMGSHTRTHILFEVAALAGCNKKVDVHSRNDINHHAFLLIIDAIPGDSC